MKIKYAVVLSTILVGLMGVVAPALADGEPPVPGEKAAAMLEAMELPRAAHELREAGVARAEVVEALVSLRADKKDDDEDRPAQRSARVLRAEAETAREHGPTENFGAFVREQVKDGVRGQELTQMIRERREGRNPAMRG
ncbi:MAG: hypothetical protein ACNA8W_19885, partial [Bradymonadaceae bacterium]